MGNSRLKAARFNDRTDSLKMDMSPMIDMVFLLLIFFMIASTMITIKLDPRVNVPIAPESDPDPMFKGRVVINIYEDGTIYGIDGEDGPELSELDVTEICARYLEENNPRGVKTRLFIRADKKAPVIAIKKATKAAGAAGVVDVIFTAYQTP